MHHPGILAALLVLTSLLAGCGNSDAQSSTEAPRILIVDLQAVAKAIGRDEVVKAQIQAAQGELQTKVGAFAEDLKVKLEEERAKVADDGSPEAQQKLRELNTAAARQMQQAQAQARQQVIQYRAGLVEEFRREIQPAVASIASSRGAGYVFAQSTALLWHEEGVDITDDVVAALQAESGDAKQ